MRSWMTSLIVVLCVMFAVPSRAAAENVNNTISYAEVAANLAMQTAQTFRAPNKTCAMKQQAFSVAFAYGVSEALKLAVHKTRPDGSDNQSFPSMHTALAEASSGWNVYLGTTIAIGTGASRVAANKHDKRDVSIGFAIGYAGQELGKRLFRCDAA